MNSQESVASYATDPREAVAAGFGNAVGLVGSDNPRYQRQLRDYPKEVTGGQLGGYGVDAGLTLMGAPTALAGLRASPAIGMRAGEIAARGFGHPVVYGGGGLAALLAHEPGVAAAFFTGGPLLGKLGQVLKTFRMGDRTEAVRLAEELAQSAKETMGGRR
jgi:hypothetical protein